MSNTRRERFRTKEAVRNSHVNKRTAKQRAAAAEFASKVAEQLRQLEAEGKVKVRVNARNTE